MIELWFDHLWGDVIRRAEELVDILEWLLVGCEHEGEVEIGQFQEAVFVDDNIFLQFKRINTGLRSRWMMPMWWISSNARTKFAMYNLALF